MLNPALDTSALAARYAEDQRVRIDNFLTPDIATGLRELCLGKVPFDYIYFDNNTNHVISPQQMAQMSAQEHRELQQRLNQQAARGIGFLYGGYRLGKERTEIPAELELLDRVYQLFNSRQMLDLIQAITASDDLVDADAQITRYTPGNFLTRHSDNIYSEGRKLAYVYSFTEHWHPDWGGLLQFYHDDGTPRDMWAPGANTLSLFDVRHVHGVSYVAPFAAAPRLSMTGWFRTAVEKQ